MQSLSKVLLDIYCFYYRCLYPGTNLLTCVRFWNMAFFERYNLYLRLLIVASCTSCKLIEIGMKMYPGCLPWLKLLHRMWIALCYMTFKNGLHCRGHWFAFIPVYDCLQKVTSQLTASIRIKFHTRLMRYSFALFL